MKKIYFLFCTLFFAIPIFSQTLDGTYKEDNDILKFNGNHIYFDMEEVGQLANNIGEGNFVQVGDFYVVSTNEYKGEKTMVEAIPATKKDTIVITVTDHSNNPLQGILVESLASSDKIIVGGVTKTDGRLLFLPNKKMKKFRVFEMGYNGLTFDYEQGKDYVVKMSDRNFIENKTVVFRIRPIDEGTIGAMLLSTDFKQGKDQQKALDALYQKALKKNYIDKRMRKEEVIFKP